jgi:hypothetical protein
MCNIFALLTQSVIREAERAGDEDFTAEWVKFIFLDVDLLTLSQENVMSTQCSRHC